MSRTWLDSSRERQTWQEVPYRSARRPDVYNPSLNRRRSPTHNEGIPSFPAGPKTWVRADDAEVDICFVHGLTGDRDSTWTAKGCREPWPKTLLPDELKQSRARIITYGYDAYVVKKSHASSNNLRDHASTFLQKLTADRERESAVNRPLIIVAHSLGGLLTKQAVLRSKANPEAHLRQLYDSIVGIVFMGTPHSGAWLANWSTIPTSIFGIVKSTNTNLLRVLQTKDEFLQALNEDFLALLRQLREDSQNRKTLDVVCFFEEIGYHKIGKIVSKASATFASDTPISVHANHRDMVRYASPEDDGFQSVAAQLRRWIEKIRAERHRLRAIYGHGRPPKSSLEAAAWVLELRTQQAQQGLAQCLTQLSQWDNAETLHTLWGTAGPRLEEWRRARDLLRQSYNNSMSKYRSSLAFEGMMAREASIRLPEKQTCLWIYDRPRFQQWAKSSRALLWIKGHPGSGKSVLMRSLFRRRRQTLAGSSAILLRFFFNARGSNMERSPDALYRTLLHSLLDQEPDLRCQLLLPYLDKARREPLIRWQTEELSEVFHNSLEQSNDRSFEIFIDALDECSDSAVLKVIRRFERSIRDMNQQDTLRVCWSSRFYPHISLRIIEGLELVVNDHNAGDIRDYVARMLHRSWHRDLRVLSQQIIHRAQGSFLWAVLTTDRILQADDEGANKEQLLKILKDIPNDIGEMFSQIFENPKFTAFQTKVLRQITRLILGTRRPLSLQELYTAQLLLSDADYTLDEVAHKLEGSQQFRKKLTHISGGLIEVIDLRTVKGATKVQVIHETVREFFLGSGLHFLHTGPRDTFLVQCEEEIILGATKGLKQMYSNLSSSMLPRTSLSATSLREKDKQINKLIPHPSWKLPKVPFLCTYVRDYFFSHLQTVQDEAASQNDPTYSAFSQEECLENDVLLPYLRLCCFDVIHRAAIRKSVRQQLECAQQVATKTGNDSYQMRNLIDFPSRLLLATDMMQRCGIFPFEKQVGVSRGDEASAGSRFTLSFSVELEGSAAPSKSASKTKDRLRHILNIHLFLSTPAAQRLMMPGRLVQDYARSVSREEAIFAVDVDDWFVTIDSEGAMSSRSSKTLPKSPQTQITFASVSALVSTVRQWDSGERVARADQGGPYRWALHWPPSGAIALSADRFQPHQSDDEESVGEASWQCRETGAEFNVPH